jgi:hypothetical protein
MAITNQERVGVDIMGAGRISDLHAIEYRLNDAARSWRWATSRRGGRRDEVRTRTLPR